MNIRMWMLMSIMIMPIISTHPNYIVIRAMQTSFNVAFSDEMTIENIKKCIEKGLGIPVERQQLFQRRWQQNVARMPEKIDRELDNHRTCAYYGFQNKENVQLWLNYVGR